MIKLHKLNGTPFTLNAELIETLEGRAGGETVVGLATGNKFVVTESIERVTELAVAYRRKINAQAKAEGKSVNPIRGFERENV